LALPKNYVTGALVPEFQKAMQKGGNGEPLNQYFQGLQKTFGSDPVHGSDNFENVIHQVSSELGKSGFNTSLVEASVSAMGTKPDAAQRMFSALAIQKDKDGNIVAPPNVNQKDKAAITEAVRNNSDLASISDVFGNGNNAQKNIQTIQGLAETYLANGTAKSAQDASDMATNDYVMSQGTFAKSGPFTLPISYTYKDDQGNDKTRSKQDNDKIASDLQRHLGYLARSPENFDVESVMSKYPATQELGGEAKQKLLSSILSDPNQVGWRQPKTVIGANGKPIDIKPNQAVLMMVPNGTEHVERSWAGFVSGYSDSKPVQLSPGAIYDKKGNPVIVDLNNVPQYTRKSHDDDFNFRMD
jgi:hypothetical protein